jgi:hypothetical protein
MPSINLLELADTLFREKVVESNIAFCPTKLDLQLSVTQTEEPADVLYIATANIRKETMTIERIEFGFPSVLGAGMVYCLSLVKCQIKNKQLFGNLALF